ncbi:MAG: methyltransferase domain-containing protein [bacterium]
MDERLAIVRGKRVERVPAEQVRAWARGFARAVVDVGTGDGRWLYRRARAHPEWACIGIDANPDRMREVSFRAARKPARGGVPNLCFIRASIDGLPQALRGIADEIYILYPWGSLLDAVWTPRAEALSAIGSLAKPGGRLEVRVNTSAVADRAARTAELTAGYAAGGIRLRDVRLDAAPSRTSWAKRIAHGRDARVILLNGTVAGG